MAFMPTPTPEEAAVLERFGFRGGTAYMEVPRCDRCYFHQDTNYCSLLRIFTRPEFGCLDSRDRNKWREKEEE